MGYLLLDDGGSLLIDGPPATGGLGPLLDALLLVSADALDDAGRPKPSTEKYHGVPPADCCDDPGTLYAYWTSTTPERTGIPQGTGAPMGKRTAEVFLRLYRCWPTIDSAGHFDHAAAELVTEGLDQDLDVVWSVLARGIKLGTFADYLQGCDALNLINAVPRPAAGGCAGVEWHLQAQWKPWSA